MRPPHRTWQIKIATLRICNWNCNTLSGIWRYGLYTNIDKKAWVRISYGFQIEFTNFTLIRGMQHMKLVAKIPETSMHHLSYCKISQKGTRGNWPRQPWTIIQSNTNDRTNELQENVFLLLMPCKNWWPNMVASAAQQGSPNSRPARKCLATTDDPTW